MGGGRSVLPEKGARRRGGACRARSLGCYTIGTSPAGFASESTMSDPSAEAVPERILLQTRSDYPEAFERLLGLARRELRIFDPDLSELEMNSASPVPTLTRFLRGSRTHPIYIALHDVGHVTKHCPRLIALLGCYTSAILIFQAH